MFWLFVFIAMELAVLVTVFSKYSYKQLYHFFDGILGVGRFALVLDVIFLPFFLLAMALFSPGSLGLLFTNPWVYLIVFIVSLVFSVIVLGDSLRVFGHRLGNPVHWFDGWKGLLYLYVLVCGIILSVVWLVLFFGANGDFAQKKNYADGMLAANMKILPIIALALTARIRRHLAFHDAVAGISSQRTAAVASGFEKHQNQKP